MGTDSTGNAPSHQHPPFHTRFTPVPLCHGQFCSRWVHGVLWGCLAWTQKTGVCCTSWCSVISSYGLAGHLFWGLSLCRTWEKKKKWAWYKGWRFWSQSRLVTCSYCSIHRSSLKVVSWRNGFLGLIEYLNFKLTIALIFPQVSCIVGLLTFRVCQLIKRVLYKYWGLFLFLSFNWWQNPFLTPRRA